MRNSDNQPSGATGMPKKHPAPPGMRWGGHKAKSDTCVNELLTKILFLVGLLEKKKKEGWHLAPIAEQNKQDCASRHPGKERKTFVETFQAARWTPQMSPRQSFYNSTSWEAQLKLDQFWYQVSSDKFGQIYQNRGKELGLMGYSQLVNFIWNNEWNPSLSCRFARLVLMIEPLDCCDF